MVKSTDLVVWLSEVDKSDVAFVGGKGANLGEMIQAKFPVPNGFVLTAYSYFLFLKQNSLETKIKHLLGTVNYDDPVSIDQVSRHIKKILLHSEVPVEVVKKVFEYYKMLGGMFSDALVAIRSSATSEDSKTASFAGQQETYLNVKGEANVIAKIKEGWASLFEPRAIFYRHENKLDQVRSGISLVVQKMVESEASGVMFTIDPITNEKTKIIIEAIYGLGEYIVQGKVTPDHYEVKKSDLDIISKTASEQNVMLVKKGTDNREINVPRGRSSRQKIKDSEIIALGKLGKQIEHHYYFPQDIEWAREKGKLYIVQTRPITTTGNKQKNKEVEKNLFDSKNIILKGDPASPGVGIGHVKILKSPKQMNKIMQGDVLVAEYTNPDYVPAMKKSGAIVTERGGRTSHAAIVSREFGIPAVVGAENAMKVLKDDMLITVNGKTGEIYKGGLLTKSLIQQEEQLHLKTSTKVYVNLAEPERAIEVAKMNVDGVGLLRAEFMIAAIGTHPKKLIKEGKQKVFVDKLSDGISQICKAFYPRPVLYRATDFKTNEYRDLKGGEMYEPVEPNPMLGYRGAYRYINDAQVFHLELETIKYVRNKKGLTNLNLMIPFVRTVHELEEVKKLVNKSGLHRNHSFKLFMMVEIPSNVILLEDFIKVGIDGVSIGSNDLTMLILGTDRDNSEVATEFDERNPAVLWALEKIVKTCKKHGIAAGICGQAPSSYPDLVEKLVDWGITSVSISPDAINTTRKVIYKLERKILKK
ncbi:MAG: phosphoenolpyruvate synthase [Candidatus Levybacteria bacterium RIFCSPHIGHO2_01_FULL_36_15]|nr:MAG: phosphoenolpyruvate synthase [Candidatus Levybacteria bacterium RIFCSPHIGHO2_01_FULL_36_15]OGH37231.1 MAG: phosphoenolpyruvate synthase [Candidatus Levybacteria bacterium RIFCSPLOWO2_01_FULL_36_10]